MATILALDWRYIAFRGVVAVIFGLLALTMPVITLVALTILFGAYALIAGVVSLFTAFRTARHGDHWWELLVEGLAGLAAAAATILVPAVTLLILVFIIAGWAVFTGILEIMAASRLRRHIRGEWLLTLAGIASVVFGILLAFAPGPGAIVLAWWIGAYALVFGVLLVFLSFRLRRHTVGDLRPSHA